MSKKAKPKSSAVGARKKKAKPAAAAKQTARRARVAAALSEGAAVGAIARKEGVSSKTILADARSAEVRVLIDRMVDRYAARMEEMFATCLDVIADGMRARRVITIGLGQGMQEKVDGGPDHYAQLAAAKVFKDLCLANRPAPKQEDEKKRGWTLDELRELQTVLATTHGS